MNNFEKVKIKPLYFTTVTGKDYINYEAHTSAPAEFQLPPGATIRWKARNLKNRKYDFIIGIDLLDKLSTIIDIEAKTISLNRQIIPFVNNPYPIEQICALEPIESDYLDRLKLDHLNSEEYREIVNLVAQFESTFFKEGDKLTSTPSILHEIKTTTDNQINSKLYRYPPKHEQEVRRQIAEMEEQGIIRKSNSKYSSPLIVVPKKRDSTGEKKFRIVIDYRKLNEVTVDDKFPLPNIDSILDKLGRAQYFSTIDLAKGYHQILIKEEDRKKTAFVTPHGLYEFVRMPFGLKNAPATFQRLMNDVLREFINKTCVVYLDDVLIFSTSIQEHIKAISDILKVLKKNKLKIQIDKCRFMEKETPFLGHLITKDGLKPNPEKVSAIEKAKLPKTEKEIKSFLGLTGFYRKFIKDYAKVAQPITKYLKKDTKINANDPNYINAFEKLKSLIVSPPILSFPDFKRPFQLTTDASNFAIGAVLSQDGHPICFASRTLNSHEKNYSATDKEFLAIMWSVNYFRPYLYGNKFKIYTDHQPIKYLQAKYRGRDLSPRHQRWLLKLGEYNFDIEYLKGRNNKVADFLSRLVPTKNADESVKRTESRTNSYSDLGVFLNVEEEDVTMATKHSADEELLDHIPIKEEIVNKYKTQLILTNNKTKELQILHNKRIIFIAEYDFENLHDILRRYIKKGSTGIYTELQDSKYNFVQEKIREMFSNDRQIKFVRCSFRAQDIETEVEAVKQIALYHVRESIHSGIQETFNSIKNKIYYPKLLELITIVINQCDVCQQTKYDRHPIKPKFKHTETATDINQIMQIDIYTIMKHNFLTVIDKFSKFAAVYYLPDRNHLTIIEQLEDHFAKIGKPSKIIAGNEFGGVLVKEFLQTEGVILHLTKAHSHTGIADVERLHSTIVEKFRILATNQTKLSARRILQQAVRNYNERFHSVIRCTPMEVQRHKVDFQKITKNLGETKAKYLGKRNEHREDYVETRTTGFIKNYKAVRQKQLPRYRKAKLDNVHPSNIKRKPKFADISDSNINESDVITEEQKLIIEKAINGGQHNETLQSKFNLIITRQDIETLVEDQWLNDNIINFYMNLLMERSQQNPENLPRVYALNTFFIPCLLRSGYSAVRRWTKNVNIFAYDIIVVPVHVDNVHWCMAIIDLKNKNLKYYDSLGKANPQVVDALEDYLKQESLDKQNQPFDTTLFTTEALADTPQQTNGSDCGVFSCMIAENITRNNEITISQNDIPYLRQRMILEIIQGKLFQ